MSLVTTKRFQMFSFLNRIFPPSSPKITSPGEIDEIIKLVNYALPPSLVTERSAVQSSLSVNPATLVQTQVVPTGMFWWVHAAELIVNATGTLAGNNAQHGFITIQSGVVGSFVHVARGLFQPQDKTASISSHSIQTTSYSSFDGGGPGFFTGGGGGCGGFIVPQGMRLAGSCVGPIGTAVLQLNFLFTECDIGEMIPSVG
jgi:hypothetical protein